MVVTLLRPILALLVVTAYFGASIVAAASPIESCPAPDLAPHSAYGHAGHGHQHHHKSRSDPSTCLKCCLGACLTAPALAVSTNSGSTPAFDGTAVRYSTTLPVLAGRSVAPDPAPPKPIA